MPLREYLCNNCEHQYEEFITSQDPEVYRTNTCRCGKQAKLLPAMIGGYSGNMGPSSTRPKNSTSMKTGKAFTGNKPEEQLEFDFKEKK